MTIDTGLDGLNSMLNGGYPEGRTMLVSGTPGTGKSTLAMQFLQAGLDQGERCLYVSTEQTLGELRDGFKPFEFDLDHEQLAVTSVHLTPGIASEDLNEGGGISRSMGSNEKGFVMRTLEGGKRLDESKVRFTGSNLRQHLKTGGDDIDRVVVDSVTGLRPVADSDIVYRRILLDLIRTFNTELGATALFTAESSGRGVAGAVEGLGVEDTVQFTVHGVLRLWREQLRGQYRRFLDVMKMRGVAHDTRRYEVMFTPAGLRVAPQRRSQPSEFLDTSYLPTRIEGLDELLGGGLSRGRSVLLEHDGQADIESFLYAVVSNALDQRMSLVLAPRVDTPPRYLEQLFDQLGASMDSLLANDQLYILDAVGLWGDRENVITLAEGEMEAEFDRIEAEARGQGTLLSANTEALVHGLGAGSARELRYWLQAQFISEDDILLDVHNPKVMSQEMSSFYVDAATQVIDTWMTDHGLQYVQLRKGKSGEIGSVRLIEYIDEAPFVEVLN